MTVPDQLDLLSELLQVCLITLNIYIVISDLSIQGLDYLLQLLQLFKGRVYLFPLDIVNEFSLFGMLLLQTTI